jgi:hypothetical protein
MGAGSLVDDLQDIYVDLKQDLLLWDGGNQVDAIWEWRSSCTRIGDVTLYWPSG